MGGNGSAARRVSFGLDEAEKVTVIEGVKLSKDVLQQMRDPQKSSGTKPTQSPPDGHQATPGPNPNGHSTREIHEEMQKNFERQQALVEEQLAKLAQRGRGTAAVTGLDELTPDLIMERGKTHEEQKRSRILARQLEMKEKELASVSSFYKEQLEILEKKNFDNYKQTIEQYDRAATKAETQIRRRQTAPLCSDLQAKVLQCYRENPQQTLRCSTLAKQYMTCVHEAKKSSVKNHG
ncbi:coiled-coil-helix-coiled-coil-helix domain containing 6b [Pholidichthys leucotaenia]